MPYIVWSEKLSLGHKEIDGDHRKLVDLLNTLHDAMKERKSNEVLGSVLSVLIDYTKTHFAREEKIMTSLAYPGFAEHKREHLALVKKAEELNARFARSELMIGLDTMNFLRGWLEDHILHVDKKLSEYVVGAR